MTRQLEFIKKFEVVFWDFDGVIKDSVKAKSEAFEDLFSFCSKQIINKIIKHHEKNSGISRFKKIPIYLLWADETPTEKMIKHYCDQFSFIAIEKVMKSNWVPGVKKFLKENYKQQKYFLISATPEEEIKEILKRLGISNYFKGVFGSPSDKSEVISNIIQKNPVYNNGFLMIGDSAADLKAAKENQIAFLLRRTEINSELLGSNTINSIKNFNE